MKSFFLLSALVSVAMSASVQLQPNLLSNLRAQASASASATASPQQLSVLRLVPDVQLGPDGRVVEVVDQVRLEQAEQIAAQQRAREALGLGPVVSASSSASLSSSPVVTDRRLVDSLEVRLANAARNAARRNEQLRIVNEVAQAQAQQQSVSSVNPLLTATRLAQSLASLTPTGATSSSRAQLLESPELTAARLQQQQQQLRQQQLRQDLVQLQRVDAQRPVAVQSNGVPLVIGPDGQLVAAPLLVL